MKCEIVKHVEVAEIELADLMGIGMTFVVLGIGMSYGLSVQTDVRDDMTVNSVEYNASQKAIEANAKIPSKMPMIATVLLASIIIGLLVRYLWGSFGGQNKQ
jgi:hypothetical protein